MKNQKLLPPNKTSFWITQTVNKNQKVQDDAMELFYLKLASLIAK